MEQVHLCPKCLLPSAVVSGLSETKELERTADDVAN